MAEPRDKVSQTLSRAIPPDLSLRDVKRLFPGLDEIRFRRFVEMLGVLSARVLNYADAARALAVSQPTARDYFEIAHGTFI